MMITSGWSGLVCISTNSNCTLLQHSLFCNFGRHSEFVLRMHSHIWNLQGMHSLNNSYINFLLLSPTFLNKISAATSMHLWSSRWKSAQSTLPIVITYVYAKNSAPRAERGFLNDVQNTNSNCDITMWAGIYNFLMNRGECFDWNYFL